jgi:CHASE2 domain-containing sensor protein
MRYTAGPLQLTTNSLIKFRIPIFLIIFSFITTHLCFWILPKVFGAWNAQIVDQLFILRSKIERFRPEHNNTVVHLDFNNSSIEKLNTPYLNRSHFAQLARNLTSMKIAAQVYDYIFAAKINKNDDDAFIEATNFLSTDFGLKKFNVKSKKERIQRYRRYVYEAGALNQPEKGNIKVIEDKLLEKERSREFELSKSDRFRFRTRYFTDSGIIGSKEFVSTHYRRFRNLFYSKHEKKPKPIKGLDGMYSLKRLSGI